MRPRCTGCRWSRMTTTVGPPDHGQRSRRYACGHARALDGAPVLLQLQLAERYVGATDDTPDWCPLGAGPSHPGLGAD